MKTYYMSRNGYEKFLKKIQEIAVAIQTKIKEMGNSASRDNDLRENPEFMQLRTEVTYTLPKKMNEMVAILKSCQIIEEMSNFANSSFDKVQLGAEVTVQYDNGNIITFLILGYDESDAEKNIISYLSPIAQSLLGKMVDEEVKLEINKKTTRLKILNIQKGI